MIRKYLAILLLTCFLPACAHQHAAIVSDPPGAQVFIDGEEIGVTPCNYDYNLTPGATREVTIAKSGFDPIRFEVKADEVDATTRNKWLAAGVVWSPLWIGTLFTKKFKDTYEFILSEKQPHLTASADAVAATDDNAL